MVEFSLGRMVGNKGQTTMRVFQSEDEERKYVEFEDNNVACFAYGEWFDRKVIDIASMRELDIEEEVYEVGAILRQARKALRYH